jgi:hypothetical protein
MGVKALSPRSGLRTHAGAQKAQRRKSSSPTRISQQCMVRDASLERPCDRFFLPLKSGPSAGSRLIAPWLVNVGGLMLFRSFLWPYSLTPEDPWILQSILILTNTSKSDAHSRRRQYCGGPGESLFGCHSWPASSLAPRRVGIGGPQSSLPAMH